MTAREQLMECITQDIIAFLVEDEGIDYTDAMNRVYLSQVYTKLLDEGTGLYLESSAYIYSIFLDECQNERMIQNEI